MNIDGAWHAASHGASAVKAGDTEGVATELAWTLFAHRDGRPSFLIAQLSFSQGKVTAAEH